MTVREQLAKQFKKLGVKVDQAVNGKWEVRRTIWPFEHGWVTYHTGKKMILDTGLHAKAYAQALCDSYNSGNLHPEIDPNKYPTDMDQCGCLKPN